MRYAPFIFVCMLFAICFSSCGEKKARYEISPVDKLMRDLTNEKSYSVILYDMELDEGKKLYKHKYRITKNLQDSTSKPIITEWIKVDEHFFAENMNNMGLELASKSADGSVHKIPAPPGFNGYVGNTQYGNWKQDNQGNSFWEYYGQYAFMNQMLSLSQPRIYQNTYHDYNTYRSNPYTRHQPYYGSKYNSFGTHSEDAQKVNPNFFARKQQQQQFSNFKQKVANNPKQYTRATNRSTSTAYTKATDSKPTYKSSSSSSSSSSTSTYKSTTSSSYKSTTSSSNGSKPTTTSSYKSSTSSTQSHSSSSAPTKSSSTRSSSSYSSSPSRSSSSSSSSSPSRSSSSSSSRSSSSRRR